MRCDSQRAAQHRTAHTTQPRTYRVSADHVVHALAQTAPPSSLRGLAIRGPPKRCPSSSARPRGRWATEAAAGSAVGTAASRRKSLPSVNPRVEKFWGFPLSGGNSTAKKYESAQEEPTHFQLPIARSGLECRKVGSESSGAEILRGVAGRPGFRGASGSGACSGACFFRSCSRGRGLTGSRPSPDALGGVPASEDCPLRNAKTQQDMARLSTEACCCGCPASGRASSYVILFVCQG